MILILVHIEEGNHDWFDDSYVERVYEYIGAHRPYRVVHMTSQIVDGVPHYYIRNLVNIEVDWGWGYEPEMFEGGERDYVIPSEGHTWTWVPPSLRRDGSLWRLCRENEVVLGGGGDCECLEDLRSILRYSFINFRDEPEIIF